MGSLRGRSAFAQGPPANLPSATPIRAIDGEKLVVDLNGERVVVRFIGIDAPEPEVAENTTECGFAESKQALLDAVTGKTVLQEQDAEDKDGKDRLWRHVWLVNPDGSDGGPLNEQLLFHGWVTTREEKKNVKYAERYAAAAARGQASQANLYRTCTRREAHSTIRRPSSQPKTSIPMRIMTTSLRSWMPTWIRGNCRPLNTSQVRLR